MIFMFCLVYAGFENILLPMGHCTLLSLRPQWYFFLGWHVSSRTLFRREDFRVWVINPWTVEETPWKEESLKDTTTTVLDSFVSSS